MCVLGQVAGCGCANAPPRTAPNQLPAPCHAPAHPPRGKHPSPRAGPSSPPSPRAPHLCSLGLPHLHSLGSRLLGKVTSAHSGARGFLGGGGPRRMHRMHRMHRRGRLRPSARAPTARRGRLEKAADATGQVGGIRGSPRPAPGAARTWGGIRTLDLRASEWEARKWGVPWRCASGVCKGSHIRQATVLPRQNRIFLEPEATQTCWRGSLLVASSPGGPQTFPGSPCNPWGQAPQAAEPQPLLPFGIYTFHTFVSYYPVHA